MDSDRSEPDGPPDSSVGERKRCVSCRAWSPASDGNSTMVSVKHGWRLSRFRDATGRFLFEWRCPGCWRKFRELPGPDPGKREG